MGRWKASILLPSISLFAVPRSLAMNKKYRVTLTEDERAYMQSLITTGNAAAHTQTHARILLKADQSSAGPAWTDQAISAALDVSIPTIERVRRTLVTEGLAAALQRRRPRPEEHTSEL